MIRIPDHQSFSSSLLDHIYRSFDDHNEQRMKSSSTAVDRWISTPPAVCEDRRQINHSSSTSSSDSSSGVGGFSSSDTESMYGSQKPAPFLKPIRTAQEFNRKAYSDAVPAKSKKQSKEGNLQRRALKIYGELKKVKHPISPGGKLTSFLNSLFHSKKLHVSTPASGSRKMETDMPATTSRSCLSKTPSSAGKIHRSVRFVDDGNNSARVYHSRELHRYQADDNRRGNEEKCDVARRDSSMLANDKELKLQIKEKQRRVEELAKELVKNYHHHNRNELKVNYNVSGNNKLNEIRNFEDKDEDEVDDISCGSSDLFELENFPSVGMVDRFGEELPVFETTRVDTNRAIANGFIL